MIKMLKQFDIWFVDLNPVKGSEQNGVRPCLILQSNITLDIAQTIIIAPFTSKKIENIYPYEVFVKATKENDLTLDSKVKLNHVRSVCISRIVKKIGSLEKKYYENVFFALDNILDRYGDFR